MRTSLILLFFCAAVAADEENASTQPSYKALKDDSSKGKELDKGIDLMEDYLEEERELEEGKRSASLTKVEEARADWREWLDNSKQSLGIDLRKHPRIVVALVNESRVKLLGKYVKLRKGKIQEGRKPAPGYSRGDIAYNFLVPKSYDEETARLYPLVVSLHGRATNLKHPALRKHQLQRSRIVLHNHWGGDEEDEQHEAVVIAPTGRPDGFEYAEGGQFLRQTLMLGAGVGCSDFIVDSQGMFVEVYGNAVTDAVEMSTFFAGVILRDREGATAPPVPEPELALLENLNGKPFYYVADEKTWDTVGKPFADALTKIYKDAGKEANLVIEKVKRDANAALKADQQKMAKFLQARLPDAAREMRWLFWRPSMIGPMPLLLDRANYDYDGSEHTANLPLREKCGLIKMKVSLGREKDTAFNLIELEIYEAESARMFLYEPLVDLDLPITVKVNGNVIVDKEKFDRNWDLFNLYCMSRKIFTFPVVAHLDFQFPFKARVEPPKVEEKKGEGEEAKEGGEGQTADAAKDPATADK